MFGSTKELLIWIVGTLVAAGITILAAFYVVDRFIDPRDPKDPLAVKGGLRPEQDVRGK